MNGKELPGSEMEADNTTGKALLQWAVAELGAEKRLEAELLLGKVLEQSRALLLAHADEAVTAEQEAQFRLMVQGRKHNEPLQYLVGTTNFMGMDFKVTPDVLIPRFDTEKVTEHSLQLLQELPGAVVVDVCTGSGAIAVSLAKYSKAAQVWATDLSEKALTVAGENSQANGVQVQFRQGDLLEPFGTDFAQAFDLIVSNPPYITSDEIRALPGDVLKEPLMALWGGADGLYFYRKITQSAAGYLKPGGYLVFEIGFTQGQAVKQLLADNGFEELVLLQDWQGLDRVISGRWPKQK